MTIYCGARKDRYKIQYLTNTPKMVYRSIISADLQRTMIVGTPDRFVIEKSGKTV